VVLSTHILAEVEAICRRVILIHGGRKVLDASLAELTQGERLEDVFTRVTLGADRAALGGEA
jgi:ABC-type Na+ transport system ATPase subunit NatA